MLSGYNAGMDEFDVQAMDGDGVTVFQEVFVGQNASNDADQFIEKIKCSPAIIEILKLKWPFPPETVSRFCRLNDDSPWLPIDPAAPWPPK